MNVEQILRALQARAPWRNVVNRIVHLIGAQPHLGFEDTLVALTKPGALNEEQVRLLERYLVAHLISGEKSIRLYKVSAEGRSTLQAKARSANPKAHPLVDAFPAMLSEGQVRELGRIGPRFCRRVVKGKVSALVFTGAETFRERVPLDNGDLKDSVLDEGRFDRIYGVRQRFVHVYQSVLVHADLDVVVVACDVPRTAPADFASNSHAALAHRIARITGEDIEPINLWPAVSGLYDSDEGRVVELGFITNDESVKHLKARRHANCLRTDVYHCAGAESVGDSLEPFKLAIRWHLEHTDDISAHPELLLPGNARMAFKSNAELYDAIVRDGLSIRDLRVVVSKLANHV